VPLTIKLQSGAKTIHFVFFIVRLFKIRLRVAMVTLDRYIPSQLAAHHKA
jgi:hypothetical protein